MRAFGPKNVTSAVQQVILLQSDVLVVVLITTYIVLVLDINKSIRCFTQAKVAPPPHALFLLFLQRTDHMSDE